MVSNQFLFTVWVIIGMETVGSADHESSYVVIPELPYQNDQF
jgi:hypothetical protein